MGIWLAGNTVERVNRAPGTCPEIERGEKEPRSMIEYRYQEPVRRHTESNGITGTRTNIEIVHGMCPDIVGNLD
jgi:hypothetical protein